MSAGKSKRAQSQDGGGLLAVSQPTGNTERHWIGGKKRDLPVYRIPVSHLYFNIENGRYADRMLLVASRESRRRHRPARGALEDRN